jgi:hypothetical protein
MSNSSRLSMSFESIATSRSTTFSSAFFSRPSSCARAGSFQMSAVSNSRFRTSSRFFFRSKSKIPPEFGGPLAQVADEGIDLIQAFGFHGVILFLQFVKNRTL